MYEFCTLRDKAYAYDTEGKDNIKAKGISGHIVKNHMTFEDLKRCLLDDITLDIYIKRMNQIIYQTDHLIISC